MEDNTFRHALWAWAIHYHGWEPVETPAGLIAADFFQAREIDIWAAPLEVAIEAALGGSPGAAGLVVGHFEGALRIQRSKPREPGDEPGLLVYVLRGGKWHGLGFAADTSRAVDLCIGARPKLQLVPHPG